MGVLLLLVKEIEKPVIHHQLGDIGKIRDPDYVIV
jgi:hypothetical protein